MDLELNSVNERMNGQGYSGYTSNGYADYGRFYEDGFESRWQKQRDWTRPAMICGLALLAVGGFFYSGHSSSPDIVSSGDSVSPAWNEAGGKPDRSIVMYPYFQVLEGKMPEFKRIMSDFYKDIEPEEEGMIYYGFAVNEEEHMVVCREAYEHAEGLLLHLKDVGPPLQKALEIAALVNLQIHGPAHEISKLKDPLAHLNPEYFELDRGSWVFRPLPMGSRDTSVTLYPHFFVDAGKMPDFKRIVSEFHQEINPAYENMLYYGFAEEPTYNQAFCRESYADAEGVLHHMRDTRQALQDALKIAVLGKLEVMGPRAELEKLNKTLAPLGAKFFIADESSTFYKYW
eukprot:gnl/TRDRNA2_/TRDRNA2_36825_c0_seq1.p1 gnl/TRDRNA2_/TRDRNA2_36825_c0~~gnl/TRDRNA2_/TRDRNA2_36825_c0_seq1.p1  ORF type:complete len:372 (+),score=64.46 gnl/TRDRNA2_/TRDRNA2_36825_c0_seq1:87-1118(+)